MASLRKRNNRWEVRVRRSGQPTQTKTFTLKSDAQQWAREAEIALEKGELLQKPKVSPITLEGAVKRYLDEVAIHHKGRLMNGTDENGQQAWEEQTHYCNHIKRHRQL